MSVLPAISERLRSPSETITTSAAIEAVNGLLQLARRRARGYRTFINFQAMAYWIAGGLDIEILPSATH